MVVGDGMMIPGCQDQDAEARTRSGGPATARVDCQNRRATRPPGLSHLRIQEVGITVRCEPRRPFEGPQAFVMR